MIHPLESEPAPHTSESRLRLRRPAGAAQALPVPFLIPESALVAAVRFDVVGLLGWCRASISVAAAHHGGLSAWAHAAERVAGTKGFGASVPFTGVATRMRRPLRLAWGNTGRGARWGRG